MKVTDVLSREEIAACTQKSDWAGLRSLCVNWLMIAACFALVAFWPNVLIVLLAMVLLGGRQLGLAVLMHDCGHRSLLRNSHANLWIGRWLCAAPIFSNLDTYFEKHQRHHAKAGSLEDPDLANYQSYAVSKASFRRKVLRDLTGITGVRTLGFAVQAGGWRFLWRPLLMNGAMLALFAWIGRPELYLLWLGSWLTTNMLYSRLRQAAEHAVVPNLFDPDPRQHTRTTLASWWERLTLAPNRVNFHLEHHLLPSVPPHRLARLHRLLRERGFYEQADIANGYGEVVGRLTVARST